MTDLQAGKSITAQDQEAVLKLVNNAETLLVQVTGTYTGALTVQGRIDGANWVTLGTIASAATGLFWATISGCEQVRVVALGAQTGTAVVSMRTSIAANPSTTGGALGGAVPITTVGQGYNSSASKTRPNDTNVYAAGDVIAESAAAGTVWTFASIGPSGGRILITAVALEVDVSAVPAGMDYFRLHLYDASPTAINDNAAFDLPSGDRTKYLGYIDIPTPQDLGATLWAQDDTVRKQVKLASGSTSLYGILETRAAFTPTAQAVKTVSLRAVRVE